MQTSNRFPEVAVAALLLLGSVVPVAAQTATLTDATGQEVTLTLQSLESSRGYIYCELVFDYGERGNDIYTTSHIDECDVDWWDGLDLEAVAAELGAQRVFKNGPQWWSMDEVAQMEGPPVTIGGVEMAFGANLPPGTMAIPKYTVFNPAKFQNLTWKAGHPTYRIVDADGHQYVLQGHKIPADELAELGARMTELPDGWAYRVVVPEEDLVMRLTPAQPIPSVQDEFDQIYIRVPE